MNRARNGRLNYSVVVSSLCFCVHLFLIHHCLPSPHYHCFASVFQGHYLCLRLSIPHCFIIQHFSLSRNFDWRQQAIMIYYITCLECFDKDIMSSMSFYWTSIRSYRTLLLPLDQFFLYPNCTAPNKCIFILQCTCSQLFLCLTLHPVTISVSFRRSHT